MHWFDYLILAVILFFIILSLKSLFKRKGSCEGCGGCSGCSRKETCDNEKNAKK